MLTNADATLYHKTYDAALRTDVWTRTAWPGVNWHGGQAVAVGRDGLSTADVYRVRICTGGPLAAAPGDILCRGLCGEADPQAARRAAAESFVVTAVRDARRGTARMHHWVLEGK